MSPMSLLNEFTIKPINHIETPTDSIKTKFLENITFPQHLFEQMNLDDTYPWAHT
jgi:hypothetical protein